MGQSKKLRPCPVLGRAITAAECGENRHSRYACPADCPANPFAQPRYAELLELEDRLDRTSVLRLESEMAGGLWPVLDAASAKNPAHGLHARMVWELFFRRDAGGRTFAERWEQAGFPGLKNDERVFFRAKMRMRVALLEVQRILDGERIEAIDLLAPELPAMSMVDRSIAARAVRFSTYLTWIYPLPHFWRMAGTGIGVPDFGSLRPEEIVGACAAHLGGPVGPGEARARWLAENFARIDDALTATARERRRHLFAGMDVQFGTATYELRAPLVECHAVLALDTSVDRDDLSPDERAGGFDVALVCFEEPGAATEGAPGRPTLGRILLGKKQARVEATGAARLAALRARIEVRLGERVVFLRERRDDHGRRMAEQEPAVDPKLVPPRLLEEPDQINLVSSRIAPPPPGVSMADYQAALLCEQRRRWLDTPLPVLDDRTPRDAAGDLRLRPRVVAYVKRQIRRTDEENLRTGGSEDAGSLARELRLQEIDFPPPPRRAAPDNVPDDEAEEDEFESDVPAAAADRPPAPRLTRPPWSTEESLARIEAAMDSLSTAGEGMEELAASGATVIEDFAAITADEMSEEEFSFSVSFILQAWFAMVPFGVRAPELRYEAMAAAMVHERAELGAGRISAPAAVQRIVSSGRQPELLQVLATGVVQAAEAMPKKMRPTPGAVIGTLLILRVLLDELDRALRSE